MEREPTDGTCHDVPVWINYVLRKQANKPLHKLKLPGIQWEKAEKT